MNDASVVGYIYARYYDINGNLVPLDIVKRTIAIELDALKKIKTTIGIASDVSRA